MHIVVVAGPDTGKRMALGPTPITVGRHPSNDVVLDDPWVSERHAVLRATSAGVELADLNSPSGTWIDGLRAVRPVQLMPGQSFRVGNSLIAAVPESNAGTAVAKGHPGMQPQAFPSPPLYPRPWSGQPGATGKQGHSTYDHTGAGMVVGGSVQMHGRNVAGRDVNFHDHGFRIRTRMRPVARALLWFGIVFFFVGVGISLFALTSVINAGFDSIPSASSGVSRGIPSGIPKGFLGFVIGMAVNLTGIVFVVVAFAMKRSQIPEPWSPPRRRS